MLIELDKDQPVFFGQYRLGKAMKIYRTVFGRMTDGRTVSIFTLTNDRGLSAKVIDFGAILAELHVPDAKGNMADLTLGFDKLDGYLGQHPYFGAIVGRVANRIAGGRFSLDARFRLP